MLGTVTMKDIRVIILEKLQEQVIEQLHITRGTLRILDS